MKAKISDVAKIAGVSPTTVSRVLNNRGYISKETRENVYKAMKEINYFPNDIARSLFNKRTNLIGMIVPQTSNPFFGELAFHIESICASLNYKVLLCNSLNRIDKEKKYPEIIAAILETLFPRFFRDIIKEEYMNNVTITSNLSR